MRLTATVLLVSCFAVTSIAAEGETPERRDRCDRFPDPEWCHARRAALQGDCRGLKGSEQRACIQERVAPRRPVCREQPGLQRVSCELYRQDTLACYDARGEQQSRCLKERDVNTHLKTAVIFNPLDCQSPSPALEQRCIAWRRVAEACRTHDTGDFWSCAHRFYPVQTAILMVDCGRRGKGSCAIHNRKLELCRGREGDALAGCLRERQSQVPPAAALCGRHDLIDIEKTYCVAYDDALLRCAPQLADADAMKRCVSDAIPLHLTLAARAVSFRRIVEPVH